MFSIFSKKSLSALLAIFSLSTMNFSLQAEEYYYPSMIPEGYCHSSIMSDECCYSSSCNRFYIGAFGGELYSERTRMTQTGVAFFEEEVGGPLAVDARGRTRKTTSGFGGVQIGYEWSQRPLVGCSDWSLTTAAELEAYFYHHTKKGHLMNPSIRLPEHDFADSLPMSVGVYLINGVITLNSCTLGNFSPYVGGGIGAANIFVRKAKSLQVEPPELGINHFNSKRSDSSWAFAAQAKAGIKFKASERFHIFGEYRFLYVDSSRYIFGATAYSNHVPTTTWNVNVNSIYYNAFAFGVQFAL
jgi:opacity protein-like surface antigen